ncbi:MAG: FtsK/SpoIIIE domain-containing protein, partial [Acidimicrobiales bacterium]
MRVVLRTEAGPVDLEVVVHDPTATVADLVAGLPPEHRVAGSLLVDGRLRGRSAGLIQAGLCPGCEIGPAPSAPGPPAPGPPAPDDAAELRVVGGLIAGERHPLAFGCSTLGRDPSCDAVLVARTTSGRHATVVVEPPNSVLIADEGSTSGTWVDGRRISSPTPLEVGSVAGLGALLVQVAPPERREPALLGRPAPDGRRPLHRPPAPVALPASAALTPPPPEPPPAAGPRFAWAAALVSLVGGLVLAKLVDPRLALFTLLGPAVLVGQWVEDRRRHRRSGVGWHATGEARLAAFGAAIEAAGRAEARRRRAAHPDPAGLCLEIEAAGAALWDRRPEHGAFAEVVLGLAPALRWHPPTTGPAEGPPAQLLADCRLPAGCPALAPLGLGEHLGIAGPRPATLAVARWVLLQLAAHHGPADLRLAVVCDPDRTVAWAWTGFLPHSATSGGARLLAARPDQVETVVELAVTDGPSHLVILVDADDVLDERCGVPRLLAAGAATVTIGASRRGLPSRCTSVLELDGPDGWGRLAVGGREPESLLATGLTATVARDGARRLARLLDPEAADGAASLPTSARLLDLLDMPEPTPAAVRRRWEDRSRRGLAVPLGQARGRDGPETLHVDLVADGPHALVAGTTGAGKSELLRSLVAGLAALHPPDRLTLLLVDYKGGAAFAEAARLPHVLGVVTDLGPEEAARALRGLEAELRRREQVLADLGLRDVADHPVHAGGPSPPGLEALPRVVVVVDELAALVAELPTFLDGLVQLAARGRSLGLHLVLGTQRPGGVVSAAVRANCALRCCLRVPDEADAVDVVGSTAPAHLDRRQPGRAFIRRGARDLVEVQVGLVSGPRPAEAAKVTVRPVAFGPDPPVVAAPGPTVAGDLTGLVDACRAAAAGGGLPAPRPLWLPPLPENLDGAALSGDSHRVGIGLRDDPDRQRRLPLDWRPADGPLLAMGSGTGPAVALRAVAGALTSRSGPGRLHVYGFDLGAQGLAPLAALAHVGALVRPGEPERLHRLIRRLAAELTERQARSPGHRAGEEGGPPLLLILIDNVAGLRAALEGTGGLAALDAVERVVVDGPAVGMAVAAAADRPGSLPAAWMAAASSRLAFRGGDPFDLLALGAGRVDQAGWPEGRCLDLASGLVAQVAGGGWPAPAERRPGDGLARPDPVLALPARVALDGVLAAHPAAAGPDGVHLPLGIEGDGLGVAMARLRPGQPFVVCGASGSGRTTALAVLRASALAAGCAVVEAGPHLGRLVAERSEEGGPWRPPLVVIVDDADRVDDPGGALAALAAGGHPMAHLLAAAPSEAVRASFGHWTSGLRRWGHGLVLRPRSDLDADVLGVPLLPRGPV